jgi:hypothetical protein
MFNRAETVVNRVGAENREAVLATTILAYALSTIMTGLTFMALGYFKVWKQRVTMSHRYNELDNTLHTTPLFVP